MTTLSQGVVWLYLEHLMQSIALTQVVFQVVCGTSPHNYYTQSYHHKSTHPAWVLSWWNEFLQLTLMAYTEYIYIAATCAAEAFSTTCALRIKDCGGWWLSGCCSSVVRTLGTHVLSPGFDFWQLPAFHFDSSIFASYSSKICLYSIWGVKHCQQECIVTLFFVTELGSVVPFLFQQRSIDEPRWHCCPSNC